MRILRNILGYSLSYRKSTRNNARWTTQLGGDGNAGENGTSTLAGWRQPKQPKSPVMHHYSTPPHRQISQKTETLGRQHYKTKGQKIQALRLKEEKEENEVRQRLNTVILKLYMYNSLYMYIHIYWINCPQISKFLMVL